MSVHYVIDGYNVIATHDEHFHGSIRDSREKFIKLIKTKKPEGSSRNRVTVIFDGKPGINFPPDKHLDVRYTSGREADWHIKKLVRDHNNPKQVIVVTDDRAIIRHVSSYGAKTMSTEDFLKKIFTKPARNCRHSQKNKDISLEEIKKINEELLKKKNWK